MKAKLLTILLMGFLAVGCHDPHSHDNGYYRDNPEVVVNSVKRVDSTTTRYARFIIEFENIGYGTAYDVGGYVNTYFDYSDGTSNILESRRYEVGYIRQGEIVTHEVVFTSFESHSEYDRYTIDLGWYDGDNYYYD